jgi:outer membrane biosynthesis protein TonB
VAVLFHDFVVQERLLSSPYRMTIGEDAKSDFPLVHPSVGAGPVPLVSGSVQAALLHVYPGMEGDLYVGTERYAASQASTIPGARSEGRTVVVPLTQDTRAKLSLGPLLFFVRCTRRPVVVIPSALFQDTGLPFLLASALLHLMVLGALAFSTAIPDVRRDAFRIDERLVQLLIQDLEPEPDPVEPETEVEDEEEEEAAGNEPAAGEAGRAGAEDIEPEPEPSRMAVEGTALSPEDVELARAEAREAVQDRGLLAVMNGPTNPFGSAMPNGMDAVTAIGAVQGNSTGASWGSGGLAAFGGGIGGGGRSMQGGFSGGSISLASRNSAVRQQAASTAVNLRENRRAAVPTLGIDGSAEIQGQLDREMIQRVVREHRREIRACYEAQLQRNPELEGRVQINWIISPDGAVAAARVSTTTLNSRDVEECMVRRIRQWRFPEPRGGGTVNVNFPFDFAPGG